MRIISRDLWALSETSIEFFDLFKMFFSRIQKMLLFPQFLSDVSGKRTYLYFFGSDKLCQSSIQITLHIMIKMIIIVIWFRNKTDEYISQREQCIFYWRRVHIKNEICNDTPKKNYKRDMKKFLSYNEIYVFSDKIKLSNNYSMNLEYSNIL